MSFLSLKHLILGSVLSSFAVQVASSPIVGPSGQYAEHALRKRASLNVKKTTATEYHTIDWVPIESQGEIASPPPHKSASSLRVLSTAQNASSPVAELQQPGAELGPPGTVPVPRARPDYLNNAVRRASHLRVLLRPSRRGRTVGSIGMSVRT